MFTKHILWSAIVLTTAAFTCTSCQKDSVEAIDANVNNTVSVEFDNRIGDQKLALGTTSYKTAAGEDFTVTTLNYFVSNITLKKADGSVLKSVLGN